MSSSYNVEQELRKLAAKLREEASDLETAADVLRILRDEGEHAAAIADAKKWAKEWLKR